MLLGAGGDEMGLGMVALLGLIVGAVPASAVVLSGLAGRRGPLICIGLVLLVQALIAAYLVVFELSNVRSVRLEDWTRVIVFGLALNAAWMVPAIVVERVLASSHRARAVELGVCAACGYPRAGDVCPECGATHERTSRQPAGRRSTV